MFERIKRQKVTKPHLAIIPPISNTSLLILANRHSGEGGRAAPMLRLIKTTHVFEHTAGPVPWLQTTQL